MPVFDDKLGLHRVVIISGCGSIFSRAVSRSWTLHQLLPSCNPSICLIIADGLQVKQLLFLAFGLPHKAYLKAVARCFGYLSCLQAHERE